MYVLRDRRAVLRTVVLDDPDTFQLVGLHHEWRVCRVHDLRRRAESLVDEAEEVGLSTSVERHRRLVEQYNDIIAMVLELGERGEEREKPLEPLGPLRKVPGKPVPTVLHPHIEVLHDRCMPEAPVDGLFVCVNLDRQVRILLPVLEHLQCQLVTRGFQFALAGVEILFLDRVRVSAGEP